MPLPHFGWALVGLPLACWLQGWLGCDRGHSTCFRAGKAGGTHKTAQRLKNCVKKYQYALAEVFGGSALNS